ncbi:hypothetical protein M3672_10130 [Microbacterium enclense]|uniref:hypothetical protein n=1 Tax=Microbacterium enclense TaxID=993073 RepID=UPI00203DEA69|nr:hypothetical protein [Microbacterium enclense]MCM3614791.1 hypothetical protein [Microbacterium enclense]
MERDADEQERRALRSIEAINAGADVGAEALALSNEFTDRHTDRMTAWVKRRFRGAEGDSPTR